MLSMRNQTRSAHSPCPAQIVNEHIHRVYVVDRDEEPRVQAVITPTDILRWAAAE